MTNSYDVVVIGAGPGGYVAAIKSAQLGHKVACIDKRARPGGTCLNVGCIPSKALLNSTHKYYDATHDFSKHGIEFDKISFSLSQMMQRKETVVNDLGRGILGLFRKNSVDYICGEASVLQSKGESHQIKVMKNNEELLITATNIIIATGSQAIDLPNIPANGQQIVLSDDAISFSEVPNKMLIVGGGVIGLEIGSIWSRLGSAVTVIESNQSILKGVDQDMALEMQKILEQQGLKFIFNAKVQACEIFSVANESKVKVRYINGANGEENIIDDINKVLIAVGRKPYTKGLGLEEIGVVVNQRGQIMVDQNLQTKVPGIYAIGDLVDGPMLAHKASEEAIFVAEVISGQKPHINYQAIPSIVYTHPEFAFVGKGEKELIEKGQEYKIGKFPLMANSRSKATGEISGCVKLIACAKTDEILGASIIAPCAGEIIGEIVVGMEFKAASEDIARIPHGHPNINEAIQEAAMSIFSKPIHF